MSCSVPNEKVCLTPPSPDYSNPAPSDDGSVAVKQQKANTCVHRWAYKLARSPDPASVVAEAVMGACRETLLPLTYALYELGQTDETTNPDLALSERTGRHIPLGQDVYDDMRATALFHVVQARAGKCNIP